MKQLIEIKNSRNKTLRLQYELSDVCNYKCWYCFPGSNEGTTGWPDVKIVKKNLSKVIEFYFENDIDEIQINFLGGEPTLWKDLGELIKYISENTVYDRKKKKVRITVQTNGSRTLRWWKEFGHYFDHVIISIHHERVDLEHVVNVVETLLEKRVLALTTVPMDHTAWDKCRSMVDYLISTKKKFMVLVKPIHIHGVTTYTEEQEKYLSKSRKRSPAFLDIIRHLKKFYRIPRYTAIFDDGTKKVVKNDHYFIMKKLNRFLGWTCTIGTNFLTITREGYLSGTCKAKLYGKDDYFNINDPEMYKNFSPTLQPVICYMSECRCAGETVLSKWKVSDQKKVIPIYENRH